MLLADLIGFEKILPFAIFGLFASIAWWVMGVLAAGKPRAEERLEELKHPVARKRGGESLQTSKTAFDLSPTGHVKLNENKVPRDLIKDMMQPPPLPASKSPRACPMVFTAFGCPTAVLQRSAERHEKGEHKAPQ